MQASLSSLARSAGTICLLLSLGACERAGPARQEGAVAHRSGEAKRPKPPQPTAKQAVPLEEQREIPVERLAGIWRVIGILPGASSKFSKDDPRILGSLMSIFPEQLSWSYKVSAGLPSEETCLEPVSGKIEEGALANDVRATFAAARSRLKPGKNSAPHQWLCATGGEWGNDAEFQMQGATQMIMRWPGDIVLIMERIRQPEKNPEPLAPTGAYEEGR